MNQSIYSSAQCSQKGIEDKRDGRLNEFLFNILKQEDQSEVECCGIIALINQRYPMRK